MIRKAVVFSACLLLNLSLATSVRAEEIVVEITGNGSGSNNEVNIQSQSTTTVSQTNEANINNDVNTNANSGGNDASANTDGDTTIVTGDVNTQTTVNNQNINSNVASGNACNCSQSANVNVSGNGAGSNNSTYLNNNNSTSVIQLNNAKITNNITVNANTGYNKASFNGGSSVIITGNIKAKTTVSNKNINNSFNSIDSSMGSATINLNGNGAYSDNNISVSQGDEIEINVKNYASIFNNIDHILNTGGNETLKNLGDSVIVTGDIESDITVENENINSSVVEVECDCPAPENPQPPVSSANPSNPGSGTSIVQGASGSTGPGSSSGTSLPKTGLTIPLTFVATLIFLFMFLSGLYLRFHSSKAPPTV